MTIITKNEKFFKFTEEIAKLLRSANLSKNARTLWDYIVTTNPFGDEEITSTEILAELNWKEHTYYRAKKELEKAGLVQTKKHQCTLMSTLKTKVTKAVNTVTKTVKDFHKNYQPTDKNCKNNEENCQNQELKTLSINDSGLSQTIQTISDLSDQSEGKGKSSMGNGKRKDTEGLIDDRKIEEEIDGLINEKLKETDKEIKKEEPLPLAPCPLTFEDERLKNEEFIRYAQGKLPKARDIKRYLLTKDKTTGDRILERLWLEYQQWKTGNSNPNSTGNEYFDNLIEQYRKIRKWEEKFNWENVNWEKLPCFDLWLNKVQDCKVNYTFIEDNSLGFTRNLRSLFFSWFEEYYQKQPPENPQAFGLINAFQQMMGGGTNYAY